ncbi:spore germination lipoprotein GerD [Desulfuribacillus alkaliarsenatis]|uniref:Spore germination GerD central core domain-containing protein n=1 Tax=Desulfuribacillus alkaliarsenatis TaxID=766136 RepID=A0A1E5G5C6_9FIRM|nr:spore germination lipoprotein GerD [Desulfuribacillus alkaliarsenatis]OEF97899.1 hypothetical protein BHF68_12560 [Desulfuribacillus alkaliarsenatis]
MNHYKAYDNYIRLYIRLGILLAICALTFLALAACAPAQRPEGGNVDYQEIKEMIVDAISSKEGREAIMELMRDPEVKKEIIVEDTDVKRAVAESLLDPKNRKILEDAMKDPKFAAEFAKTVEEEHKDILTSLLLDPDYREMLIEVFGEPDFEDILLDTLKGSEMRVHMQEIAKQAFLTPAMRLELLELLRIIQQEELEMDIQADEEENGEEDEEDDDEAEQEDEEGVLPSALIL